MVHAYKSLHDAILSHEGLDQTGKRGLEVRYLSIRGRGERGDGCVYIVSRQEELSMSSGPVRVTNQRPAN